MSVSLLVSSSVFYLFVYIVFVYGSTPSLYHGGGGGESDIPTLLDTTQVASKNATPTVSVHKSNGHRVVCAVEHVLCGVCFYFASILCSELGHVRRVGLRSVSSVVFIGGGGSSV